MGLTIEELYGHVGAWSNHIAHKTAAFCNSAVDHLAKVPFLFDKKGPSADYEIETSFLSHNIKILTFNVVTVWMIAKIAAVVFSGFALTFATARTLLSMYVIRHILYLMIDDFMNFYKKDGSEADPNKGLIQRGKDILKDAANKVYKYSVKITLKNIEISVSDVDLDLGGGTAMFFFKRFTSFALLDKIYSLTPTHNRSK